MTAKVHRVKLNPPKYGEHGAIRIRRSATEEERDLGAFVVERVEPDGSSDFRAQSLHLSHPEATKWAKMKGRDFAIPVEDETGVAPAPAASQPNPRSQATAPAPPSRGRKPAKYRDDDDAEKRFADIILKRGAGRGKALAKLVGEAEDTTVSSEEERQALIEAALADARRGQAGNLPPDSWAILRAKAGDLALRGFIEILAERIVHLEEQLTERPVITYRGVWSADNAPYQRGEFVTFGGSMWHCELESTTARPGGDPLAWVLAVKRGRAARREDGSGA